MLPHHHPMVNSLRAAGGPLVSSLTRGSPLVLSLSLLGIILLGYNIILELSVPPECSSRLSSFFPSSFDFALPGASRVVPPDPTKQLGWVENDEWVNSDRAVPMNRWLQRLMGGEAGAEMEWLTDKTVLLLGDSVVRDLVWRMCDNFIRQPKEQVHVVQSLPASEKTVGWLCNHPSYNFRMISGFIYGMTNYSKYPADSPLISFEWPAGPWNYEDRIQELAGPYTEAYDPDLVVVNSGAWDFKFLYRRDVFEGRKSELWDAEELEEYGERLRGYLRLIKATFPRAKVLWMQLQPFREDDLDARWFWAKGLPSPDPQINFYADRNNDQIQQFLPHLFSRRRVKQLAATYRRIAQEEEVDDVDYWKIGDAVGDAFIRPGDSIHPGDSPGIKIMLDFILEKLYRWDRYRFDDEFKGFGVVSSYDDAAKIALVWCGPAWSIE